LTHSCGVGGGVGLEVGVGLGVWLGVELGLDVSEPDDWSVPDDVSVLSDVDGVDEVVSAELVSAGVTVLVSADVSVGVAVGVSVVESVVVPVGEAEASAAFWPIRARVSTAEFVGGAPQTDVAAELGASIANTPIIPAPKNTPAMSALAAAGFESSALTCATSLQLAVPARRSPPNVCADATLLTAAYTTPFGYAIDTKGS
jgi:hypothetical protein